MNMSPCLPGAGNWHRAAGHLSAARAWPSSPGQARQCYWGSQQGGPCAPQGLVVQPPGPQLPASSGSHIAHGQQGTWGDSSTTSVGPSHIRALPTLPMLKSTSMCSWASCPSNVPTCSRESAFFQTSWMQWHSLLVLPSSWLDSYGETDQCCSSLNSVQPSPLTKKAYACRTH